MFEVGKNYVITYNTLEVAPAEESGDVISLHASFLITVVGLASDSITAKYKLNTPNETPVLLGRFLLPFVIESREACENNEIVPVTNDYVVGAEYEIVYAGRYDENGFQCRVRILQSYGSSMRCINLETGESCEFHYRYITSSTRVDLEDSSIQSITRGGFTYCVGGYYHIHYNSPSRGMTERVIQIRSFDGGWLTAYDFKQATERRFHTRYITEPRRVNICANRSRGDGFDGEITCGGIRFFPYVPTAPIIFTPPRGIQKWAESAIVLTD